MTSGPRIAHAFLPIKGKGASDWSYSWVPVVGPIIGGTARGLARPLVLLLDHHLTIRRGRSERAGPARIPHADVRLPA